MLLMDQLQTEARNPASAELDELTPLQLVRLMNAEDAKVTSAIASQAEAIARADIAVVVVDHAVAVEEGGGLANRSGGCGWHRIRPAAAA